MRNIFLISDLHFGHAGMVKFLTSDEKTKIRPWSDIESMNEDLIANWNSVVSPTDLVYNLGDVCLNKKYLELVDRLNGEKRLIMGNHDRFPAQEYLKFFTKIHASLKLDKFILTHYPIHVDSIPDWCIANVHGHIHEKTMNDPRYYNVSVESINYTPIELAKLKMLITGCSSVGRAQVLET